jgi:DNA-binding NarL/FixJ family response regulator
MPADEIRIVVVDDHDLFRAGLIELLREYRGFKVVGRGRTGWDALTLVDDLRPDIALLDVEMPGPGMHSVMRQIFAASPRTGVVILTMRDEPALILDLIGAGASGYLHKSADRVELAAAIGRAARHDDSVLLSVSRRTLSRMVQASETRALLSAREQEVLQLLAEAMSNREIGRQLNISEGTVKRHLTNLYAKLGAASRLDAVRRGLASGALRGDAASLTTSPGSTASNTRQPRRAGG